MCKLTRKQINEKEHDLSTEHLPGVIALEDELIVLALLTCTFSKIWPAIERITDQRVQTPKLG